MSKEFEGNVFRFVDFIKERYPIPIAEIFLFPEDDGSIYMARQDTPGGKLYPLWLLLQEDEVKPSRIRMVIPIKDDTAKLLRDRDVVRWIEDCQRWLEKFQLEEFPLTGQARLLAALSDLYDGGMTLGEITSWLNDWIARLLKEAIIVERWIEIAPMPMTEAFQILRDKGLDPNAKILALQILLWMKLEPDEAGLWHDSGLENVRSGYEPIFPPTCPIDRDRVKNRVREWKNGTG